MTVGAVEWNLASPNSEYQLPPEQVAEAIRVYVEYFFQCEECRMHFIHEFDSCSYDRCNRLVDKKSINYGIKEWKELPLWLYETHNGVNVRLRKERIERHDEEPDTTTNFQVMWPPMDRCSYCWLSQGRWDEEVTYEYLKSQYWYVVYFVFGLLQCSYEYWIFSRHGKNFFFPLLNCKLNRDEGTLTDNTNNEKPRSLEDGSIGGQRDFGGNKRISKSSVDYGDDDEDSRFLSSSSLTIPIAALILLLGVVLWYRKLQFDRKGIHKRSDSF